MKEFEINYKCQYEDCKGEPWAMPVDNSYWKKKYGELEIINPNEIITKAQEITIQFDYPLSNEVDFTFKSKNGFTRKKFYECIVKGYKRIYAAEDDPGHIPGMYNRASSEGPYGIWGHDIGDLVVEGVYKKGKKYYLHIGS